MRRLTVLGLAALILVPAAHAATKGPVFGLRAVGNNTRGYFVYSLAPGATQSGAVIVSNVGTAAGTVKLFTSDATTGRTTGTVYETDKQPTRAGSWVRLSSTAVTLAPGAHKRVPFTVHIPAGTPPGQWVGGIVAETSHQLTGAKSKQKANVQIKIRDLTIIAVQANVPGRSAIGFTIGKVTTGGQRGFQQLIVHLTSTGNVLTKPSGRVTVFDSAGKPIQTLPFTMDTFLPRTTIDYPVLLKKALPAGDYSASVVLQVPGVTGAAGKTVTAKPSFSISKTDVKQVFTSASPTKAPPTSTSGSSSSTPWALIGAAAGGAIVILLLLAWWLIRSRGRRGAQTAPPQVSPSVLAAAVAAEPAPEPATPEAPPAVPAPAAVPSPPPASRPAECIPHHFWEVAYDRGQLGGDGAWRFPHRCRNCGLELLARDISDASAQADGPASGA